MDGEEREVFKGHHGPVHCIEFSPDGEVYASGSGACYRWPDMRRHHLMTVTLIYVIHLSFQRMVRSYAFVYLQD